MSEMIDLQRRAVLRGGALVLGFTLLPRHALAEFNGMGVPPISNKDLAGSLQRTPMLDAWIRIAEDGRVTVFTGKVELGTGVRTALLQVAAEQLDVAPAAVNFITADTALTPNEGFTAGSHTMADNTVNESGKVQVALENILGAVGMIVDQNQQIAAAAEQQTAVAHDIDQNIVEINLAGERTAEGASQTEQASRELSGEVAHLKQLISAFRV